MNKSTDNSQAFTVALWAANYGLDCASEKFWMACATWQIHKAAASGASLLIMPEWLSEMWGQFGRYRGPATLDRLKWESETADRLLPELGRIATNEGMVLLAGTAPNLSGDSETWTNRARLFLPDGRTTVQDKIHFTPEEKSLPGGRETRTLEILEWNDKRIGIAICLDSESPILSQKLRQADIDLLLVPSLTSTVAGYNRVSNCARTRAIELMCPVVTVGSIGVQKTNGNQSLNNFSGASVFVPCESEFNDGSGVLSTTGLIDNKTIEDAGVLSVVKDVPVERCRDLRANNAEVWTREHVNRVIEASPLNIEGLHRGPAGRNGSVVVPS